MCSLCINKKEIELESKLSIKTAANMPKSVLKIKTN